MQINIELGNEKDIDEIEKLYDELNEYLADGINYPGWKKGIYPARQNAIDGIKNKTLFAARHKGKIIGTIIFMSRNLPMIRLNGTLNVIIQMS